MYNIASTATIAGNADCKRDLMLKGAEDAAGVGGKGEDILVLPKPVGVL